MRKLSGLITKATIGALSFAAMASNVLATGYSYNYSTSSGDDAAAAGVGIFVIVLNICLILFICVTLIFNIWMLVDVIQRTEVELPNKTMWLVLILLIPLVPAIIYFFSVRKKLGAPKKA